MDGYQVMEVAVGLIGVLQGYQLFIAKTNQKYFQARIDDMKERLNDITKRLERIENLVMLNSKNRERVI